MTLWPRSLAGRLIAALLLALVVAQVVALFIFAGERREAIRSVNEEQVLQRTAALVLLLRDSPPNLHERLIEAASLRRQAYWLDDEPELDTAGSSPEERRFAGRLAAELDGSVEEIRVRRSAPAGVAVPWHDRDEDDAEDDWDDDRPPPPPPPGRHRVHPDFWEHHGPRPWRGPALVELSLRLADGRWLNARTGWSLERPRWAVSSLVYLGAMALMVSLVVVLMVRRIVRPMDRLAAAADRLGRGESPGPLPEEGPEELRRTTRAFNRMQERLERYVRDRTQLLAAISHDLRTPITTLRLRAEFVEDAELRDRILETLEEMQRMAEETLAFAREDAATEATSTVDLAALIGSLCEDLADLGQDVRWTEAERCPLPCRPTALRRALGNLVENAVAYGKVAWVALVPGPSEFAVTIEDEGPGIPEADFERVFEPFVRLEESRSRETGGVGLGLAIARSIVRRHGGDIALTNRPEGGLRVTVTLPVGSAET